MGLTRSESEERAFLTKVLPKAQGFGESCASHWFVCMLNPKSRGPNFKWENFVQFVVRKAEVSCWQSFSDKEWKLWEKEIKEAACKSAKYAAERILDDSGLLEWWPDPRPTPPTEP